MINLSKLYAVDDKKSKDGVWQEISGSKWLLTHFDPQGREYYKVFEETTRSIRKLIEHKMLSEDKDREIGITVFVRCCLKGWSGVSVDGETELPYSEQQAIELFKLLPQLYKDVWLHAADINVYAPDADEVKN